MESRRQRPATSQRVKKKANAKAESFLAALSLPNIAQLIEDGEITIGMLRPVGCVATASDEDCNYAMLCAAVEKVCSSCSPASTKLSTRRSPWTSSPTRSMADP